VRQSWIFHGFILAITWRKAKKCGIKRVFGQPKFSATAHGMYLTKAPTHKLA
jgi:hypothetical protein